MGTNYEEIKSYLLGGLEPAKRGDIDLALIEDEDFAADAFAAEDALIESYVDGELSDEEADAFRSNYLTTEARAERVRQFAALRVALAEESAMSSRSQDRTESVGGGFFNRFFGFKPASAFAVIAIVAIVGAVVWIYLGDRPTALETQYAALNQNDMSDMTRFGSYAKVELVPGTLRSGDVRSKIATGGLTGTVLFRLPLAFDAPPNTKFRAEVLREGRRVFRVDDVRPVRDGSVDEIRLLLPREILEKGQYQISLSQPGASPVLYSFVAE